MKKFIKIGAIVGCLLILAGVGIATAAFAVGANPIRIGRFVEEQLDRFEDEYDRGYRTSHGVTAYMEAAEVTAPAPEEAQGPIAAEGPSAYEGSAAPDSFSADDFQGNGDPAFSSVAGTVGFEVSYPVVTKLQVKQSGGEVQVYVLSDQQEMTIRSQKGNFAHVSYEERSRDTKVTVRACAGEDYQIFIPAAWVLEELEVEMSGGAFDGSDVQAYEADYKMTDGEIYVSQSVAESLELECRGGAMEWIGIGEMPGEIDAECENGEIVIRIPDGVTEENLGYEMQCKDGFIGLLDTFMEGTEEAERTAGAGKPFLDLTARRGGSITVAY